MCFLHESSFISQLDNLKSNLERISCIVKKENKEPYHSGKKELSYHNGVLYTIGKVNIKLRCFFYAKVS